MNDLLEELEAIYAQKLSYTTALNYIADHEKQVRQALEKEMELDNVKSIQSPSHSLTVTRSTRKDLKIVDEPSVRTYLQSTGKLEECLRLDLPAVKKYAKRDAIPGIEEVETIVLSVREARESVEAIDPGVDPMAIMRANR